MVCGDVDGGKKQGGVSLKLPPGEITLQGDKALAYARIRHNNCDPSEDDRDRAARQQQVLNGIKGRLTSITRFPYNFIKGPFIGWDAPKAFISDMGGFTLPAGGDRGDLRRQRRDERARRHRRPQPGEHRPGRQPASSRRARARTPSRS